MNNNLTNENLKSDEFSEVREIEKKLKLIGSKHILPGMKLWSYNQKTGELKEAEYFDSDVCFKSASKGDFSSTRKLIIEDGCIYDVSINKSNALKKFNKLLNK